VAMDPIATADVWMNGGFFVFRNEIFDYINEGEELVEEPFKRLIERRRLYTVKYHGFWSCMDTFKEKQGLDDMYAQGNATWEVWRQSPSQEQPGDGSTQGDLPGDELTAPSLVQSTQDVWRSAAASRPDPLPSIDQHLPRKPRPK